MISKKLNLLKSRVFIEKMAISSMWIIAEKRAKFFNASIRAFLYTGNDLLVLRSIAGRCDFVKRLWLEFFINISYTHLEKGVYYEVYSFLFIYPGDIFV